MLRGCLDLQAQGVIVTGRSLAQATGVGMGCALMFLRLHRTQTLKEMQARQRQQKLEEVWTRLESRRVRPTSPLLAKEAGVAKKTALDFLTARRSSNHAESLAREPASPPKAAQAETTCAFLLRAATSTFDGRATCRTDRAHAAHSA